MIRGLYTAVAGMLASVRRMEVVTNNLSNTQTPGYKMEKTAGASFDQQLLDRLNQIDDLSRIGPLTLSTLAQAPELDLSQGTLQPTGRALDVALAGPGFLAIQGPEGERYTRDGSLTRNAQGFLTTSTGSLVLGDNGPIRVPDGDLTISPDGSILVDDAPVAHLRVVEFGPNGNLEKVGNNELVARDGAQAGVATATSVQQGVIEASNVDLTGTMALALQLQRSYEANQRLIQQQDAVVARAVNDIARPLG